MPEVFISYRQSSESERQRVRAFAEPLRSSAIRVILDQFFLDENPADRTMVGTNGAVTALQHSLIIGTRKTSDVPDDMPPLKPWAA